MTKSMPTGTSAGASTSTSANTLNGASARGPWQAPELTGSPDYILETLRETKHMINSLQEREKRLKADVQKMYEEGSMAHLVDDENSQKYNGSGVSVTLMPGRKTRKWDSAVQMELDKLQQEVKRVESKAEYARLYTEEQGPSYWRVTLEKEL